MPILFFLLWPLLEFYVLVRVGIRFGAMNTIFALILAGVLGAGLARSQGKYVLAKMQNSLSQGQLPTRQALHGAFIFFAGVLFLIPGFISDIVAFLLILPGSRHLLVSWVSKRLSRNQGSMNMRVFSFGSGFGGNGFDFRSRSARPSNSSDGLNQDSVRDVSPKVIDVVPISVQETTDKKDR